MHDPEPNTTAARVDGIVPGGFDRVATILALNPLLESLGVELDVILAASGLPANQFDHPDNLIPFREGSRLIGLCADHAECESLGLLIGMNTPLDSLGIVAELARSAADVGSALKLVARYLTLRDGGGLLALSERGSFATFGYAIYEPGVERAELVYDIVLAITWNILRELCGSRWLPSEVLFMRSSPSDCSPYRKFFRAALRFDTEQSALVFRREWLGVPLKSGDPSRRRALEAEALEMELRGAGSLISQLRRILRRQLLSGNLSMQGVADELAVHRRTLDRRLRVNSLSFRSIVSDVRFEVSRQLLETRIPVSDIAESLQYANPAAYTRAFRRWSGMTPSEWRKAHLIAIKPQPIQHSESV